MLNHLIASIVTRMMVAEDWIASGRTINGIESILCFEGLVVRMKSEKLV